MKLYDNGAKMRDDMREHILGYLRDKRKEVDGRNDLQAPEKQWLLSKIDVIGKLSKLMLEGDKTC